MKNLIRGDYLPFKFQLEYEDKTIKQEIVDEAIFWLKENKYSSKPLIQKKLSTNDINFNAINYNYQFSITPDETKNLNYEVNYPFAIKVFIDNKPYTVSRGYMTFDWEGVFVYER